MRPRQVLLDALLVDLRPHVRSLREAGWPAEVTVHTDPWRVLVTVELPAMRVPVEAEPVRSEERVTHGRHETERYRPVDGDEKP